MSSRHEQGDGNQVRVQDPEGQEVDEPLSDVARVVALRQQCRRQVSNEGSKQNLDATQVMCR